MGDHDATALAATVTWILKNGTGMIGGIGFAWWKGFVKTCFRISSVITQYNCIVFRVRRSFLDSNCKKWRFAADLINDTAMCIELLLGAAFLKDYGPFILSISSGMKAVVGVAGGSTRAAITQHQVNLYSLTLFYDLLNLTPFSFFRQLEVIWPMYPQKMVVKKLA